jgi:hypothetical protein
MTILNKRNAILGWSVWQVGKATAKRKAKQSLKTEDKRPGKGAIAGGIAALGGVLWFWRRRRGGDEDKK